MKVEERDKYAYELMVKNNPDEAVKQLILKDNLSYLSKILSNDLAESNKRINKALKFIDSMFDDGDGDKIIDNLLKLEEILKGEENEK